MPSVPQKPRAPEVRVMVVCLVVAVLICLWFVRPPTVGAAEAPVSITITSVSNHSEGLCLVQPGGVLVRGRRDGCPTTGRAWLAGKQLRQAGKLWRLV